MFMVLGKRPATMVVAVAIAVVVVGVMAVVSPRTAHALPRAQAVEPSPSPSPQRQLLDAVVSQITKDRRAIERTGIAIRSAWVNEEANSVHVGVAADDIEQATSLRDRYRDVTIVIDAESVPTLSSSLDNSPGLYKAGLRLGTPPGCTSGFAVRHPTTGVRYGLTAGHCAPLDAEIRHAGTRFGQVAARQFQGDIDALAFTLESGLASNFLFRGNDWLVPMTNFGDANVGWTVCAEGAGSGHRCGAVLTTNATIFYPEVTLTGIHVAGFCSSDGDSGGPVYQPYEVYAPGLGVGIVSGHGFRNGVCGTFYTPVQRVVSRFGLAYQSSTPYKTLRVLHSGKCVDADIAGAAIGVQQWDCNGWNNQTIAVEPIFLGNGRYSEWYRLRFLHNRRCLSFVATSYAYLYNGGRVEQQDCGPSNYYTQNFQFIRGSELFNSLKTQWFNNRCIDINVAYAPYENGTDAQQWDCNGWANQYFILRDR